MGQLKLPRLGGLWQHRDFLRLWTGETISYFGAQVSALALPLTAAMVLAATPAQMGYLNASRFAPFLLISLFAGVWIDRRRRRPLLVTANTGRALFLALIPLGALMGWLRMEYLYVVAFLIGSLSVVFDLAYQSYLPSLVEREHLIEANSKLQTSASAAEVGGPGVAGLLIQWLGAPIAIVVNTVSFAVSAVAVASIRKPETGPPLSAKRGMWLDIGEGLSTVIRNPYLRAVGAEAATYNLFSQALFTVFILYATRDLGMGAGLLGLLISMAAVGALVGAMSAGYIARRFGLGRTIVGSMGVACLMPMAYAVVHPGMGLGNVVGLLIVADLLGGFGVAISNVHVVSLRQAITPNRLLGRMNASYRFFVYGAIPLGALLGGGLGGLIGLRPTLLVSALGLLAGVLWVVFSPVRGLLALPDEPVETEVPFSRGPAA